MTGSQGTGRYYTGSRSILPAVIVAIVGLILIVLTIELARESHAAFLVHQRDRLIAAEIALFGITVVELASRTLLGRLRERGALQTGITLRAVLRTIAYTVLAFSVIAVLASNAALAIGVGSITGLVIGFAAQNLIGNLIAGMFLAIARPFTVGDQITIMGMSGRVVEIGVIHTLIDADDQWVFIPSMAVMTMALQRRKEKTTDQDTDS